MSEVKSIWRARKRIWCGLPWTFTVYTLTEDRFLVKTGIFNIREDEVRLYRIKDLVLQRSFIQRIFGLGTIQITSTDSSLKNFSIINVRDSHKVKEQLSQLVEEERQRKRVSSREIMTESNDEMDEDNTGTYF